MKYGLLWLLGVPIPLPAKSFGVFFEKPWPSPPALSEARRWPVLIM